MESQSALPARNSESARIIIAPRELTESCLCSGRALTLGARRQANTGRSRRVFFLRIWIQLVPNWQIYSCYISAASSMVFLHLQCRSWVKVAVSMARMSFGINKSMPVSQVSVSEDCGVIGEKSIPAWAALSTRLTNFRTELPPTTTQQIFHNSRNIHASASSTQTA